MTTSSAPANRTAPTSGLGQILVCSTLAVLLASIGERLFGQGTLDTLTYYVLNWISAGASALSILFTVLAIKHIRSYYTR